MPSKKPLQLAVYGFCIFIAIFIGVTVLRRHDEHRHFDSGTIVMDGEESNGNPVFDQPAHADDSGDHDDEKNDEETCVPDWPGGFLTEREGRIAVFHGHIDRCHQLQTITDLPVEPLSDDLREALQRGILFSDRSDLPQILDGLYSTD